MAYLKSLGLDDLDTFSGRVSIQKVVYLLKQFGADLRFGYNWYAHGPYSPDLTRTLFNASPEDRNATAEPTADELRIINNLRNFLGTDLYSVDSLELVASLIYLINRGSMYELTSKAKIISFLREKKPHFSDEQIEKAWSKIQSSGKWQSKLQELRS
jgi:hypothetical protein